MIREIDALASSTLKHLRDHWWDDSFTAFLEDTLKPKPGKRILNVGSGSGMAEKSLARLRLSQVQLFGVDLILERLRDAREMVRGMNARAGYAAADACHLPFADAAFDSTFCVAVLQHIGEVPKALAEFARVTRAGGRILAVEPDSRSLYWYSSVPAGMEAFELGRRFFASLTQARSAENSETRVGPLLPGLFLEAGIEPLGMHLFPVSRTRLGPPAEAIWEYRRARIRGAIEQAPDEAIRRLGADYLKKVDQYAAAARHAGPSFVEVQNTMLFATVGQRAG
jgi:SAM-dependent methyltransferase